ncbi:PPE domain-containing protein [Nocardia speluncae]|uniref:PPE domain-containing protein n=1 Tax=Nocardia speluncae TaxID=419477 RepID=A0A846X8H4_9NOCA|nr:PPE domain-containing protein [Nocardia speluncae]NKY31767.1 PPE domain-containing protein [Nocardia speluncae]
MIEPPAHGFTGVVWEARPAEKLATDLITGGGTMRLADAVAAWTRLGTQFGTAALDYDRIVAELRQAWRSESSAIPLERLAVVRDWLLDAAGAAAANATRVAEHIATYELARAAMPHPEEVAALAAAQETIAQVSAILGAPLTAIADDTEFQQDAAKSSAARVMRTYEAASDALATPWQHAPPPVVVSDSALRAEEKARAEPRSTVTPVTHAPRGVGPGFPRVPSIPLHREPGAYRAVSIVQATTAPTTPAATTTTAASDPGSNGPMPGAAGPGAAAASTDDRGSRAGDAAPYRADPTDLAEAIQAAPAVLGATAPANAAHDAAVPAQQRGTP